MSENAASSRRTATRSLVLCALLAALTAICSQIQIPLPMVPLNLALFAVHLSGALLGWKYGALSMVVYALLGVIGVPVFACIQELLKFLMDRRLRKRNMPTEAYAYVGRAKDSPPEDTPAPEPEDPA